MDKYKSIQPFSQNHLHVPGFPRSNFSRRPVLEADIYNADQWFRSHSLPLDKHGEVDEKLQNGGLKNDPRDIWSNTQFRLKVQDIHFKLNAS